MFQFFSTLQIEVELGPKSLAQLSSINASLASIAESLATLAFRRITSIELNLPGTDGGTMPFSYKADKADFIVPITLQGQDSEGNTLPDVNIPIGHTLTVVSSDILGLTAIQDPLNPKAITYHVGEPNTDETPRPVTISAALTRDADSVVILSASDSGVVTVGDAVGPPTGITLGLPTS